MRCLQLFLLIFVLTFVPALQAQQKTALLPDAQLDAIAAEASGSLAKDTIIALGRLHRVQASPEFHEAALYIAQKAREYGLQDVAIESFPADGVTTYNTFKSYLGWEAEAGVLTETAPRPEVIADYSKQRVALADYSNKAEVTTELIDVGAGTAEKDYAGKDVKGKIVLAGGNVETVHREAVEVRDAAGVLSYQPNQVTGWSGDYQDLVRWGHLSPYNTKNTFAFMISLRQGRAYQARLARGEQIRLRASVKARIKPGYFEVVTGIIPGTDPSAGEIVFSCHLCHQKPGANDNASGAATILEDARLLVTLIKQGKLPRPRRTIRFIWPPEIAGTMCYFARHPDLVKQMRAAVHMDMVGGDYQITKAVFHLTRTPASLPSYVNDVAAVFGEYVIEGSRRAAEDGDFSAALLSPEGTKERLVADVAPFSMGSDHEVFQEGSFRIPTIYLNDWPDVFIHTNNDTPANIDATKLQRVAVIGAAAGYFMASAAADEAKILAGEIFTRGQARQGVAAQRALALLRGGTITDERIAEARNMIKQASEQEMQTLASVTNLAPQDKDLTAMIAALSKEVVKREAYLPAALGKYDAQWNAPPKSDPADTIVPKRNPKVIGNLDVFGYDYVRGQLGAEAIGTMARLGELPNGGTLMYETLNLVNGQRSVREIRDVLAGAYGVVPTDAVLDYLKLLEKAGVVTLGRR